MARKKDTESVRRRKRDEILDAAMTVFEKEGGLEALSLRKLAAELSLSYSANFHPAGPPNPPGRTGGWNIRKARVVLAAP